MDKDASKLDLSTTGSVNVTSKFLESMERQARNVISIISFADLFATAAFSAMQSDDMDTSMLRRLVEALVYCLKHSTSLSFFMTVELMLTRRELAISGSEALIEASKDSLRSVPFSVNSLLEAKSQRFKRLIQRLVNSDLLQILFLRNLALHSLNHHSLGYHESIGRSKILKGIFLDLLDSFRPVEMVLGFPEVEAL